MSEYSHIIVISFSSVDALEPLTVDTPNAINAIDLAAQRPAVSELLRGHFGAHFNGQAFGPMGRRTLPFE